MTIEPRALQQVGHALAHREVDLAEVDVEHPAPVLRLQLQRGAHDVGVGVVDHVRRCRRSARARVAATRAQASGSATSQGSKRAAAAGRGELVGDGAPALGRDVGEHHGGALLAQAPGRGGADAAGGAGDDRAPLRAARAWR